jgi:hypothetical protein
MTNQEFTQHITESADFDSLVVRPLPEHDMYISVYWGKDHNKKSFLLGVNFFMGVNVPPNNPNLTTFFDHMQDTMFADEKLTKYVNLWHSDKGQPSIESVAQACVLYPQFEELFSTPTESTSDRIEYYASVYDFVQRNNIWEKASNVLGDDISDLQEYRIDEAVDAIQAICNEELDGDGSIIVSKANWQKEKDGFPIQVEWLNIK